MRMEMKHILDFISLATDYAPTDVCNAAETHSLSLEISVPLLKLTELSKSYALFLISDLVPK